MSDSNTSSKVRPTKGPLMSVVKAAQLLDLSRSKVYELIGSGRLPSYKMEGSRKVHRRDLIRYIESCRVGSTN
jgi:excisionase family DNA binding protein